MLIFAISISDAVHGEIVHDAPSMAALPTLDSLEDRQLTNVCKDCIPLSSAMLNTFINSV